MEMFKKGDRVSLKEPLGALKPESVGIIVETYADNRPDAIGLVVGTKDFEDHTIGSALFDYGVAFPQLHQDTDPESAAWITDKVNLEQFHAGYVIPVAHSELVFVDSTLRDIA